MSDHINSISITALARGEEYAWKVAYAVLYKEIWIVLKAKIRPGTGVDIEDLAVEILTDEVMPGIRDRKNSSFAVIRKFDQLISLARTIAARRSVDLIRRLLRRKEESLPEGWQDMFVSQESDLDMNNESFWLLVNELKPPKPELFADYFIGGLNYGEIAAAHGIALGTVCSHFKRGLDTLRCLLIEKGGKPQ